eukprot:2869456-Karenia_brevis.AAC.1
MLITKFNGHATQRDVLRGAMRAVDRIGNDCSDRLASAAAIPQEVNCEEVFKAQQRKLLTQAVQNMMLEMLETSTATVLSQEIEMDE